MEKATKNSFVKQIINSKVASSVFLKAILGMVLTTLSFYLFIELREGILGKQLFVFDNRIMSFLYLNRTPFLTSAMLTLSFFGREVTIVIGVLLTIALYVAKHKKEALFFVFITGMAPVISGILKNLIQRPRPAFHPLVPMIGYDFSFPSGHAMGSFVFYTTLSYFVFYLTKNRRITVISAIFSTVLIFLIGISRIYLGVHYPSDVLAGYLGGLCWFSSILTINKVFVFYKLFKKRRQLC